MTETRRFLTAEALMSLPDDGFRYELVAGQLVREPQPGAEHGVVAARLCRAIERHAEAHDLGEALQDVGFLIAADPDTVRAPDVAFIARAKIEEHGIPSGFWRFAPDLAIEVLSPSDRRAKVEAKVSEWIEAGCLLVAVVDPPARSVVVHHRDGRTERLTEVDVLEGGEALPGLAVPLAGIFV